MYLNLRILGSSLTSSLLLLACISSAGIGKLAGDEDGGVGGSNGSPTGGASTASSSTSTAAAAGGTTAANTNVGLGGALTTGGVAAVGAGGNVSVSTGGAMVTGGSGFGTSGSCDFTNAACNQGVCTAVQPWEQTACQSLVACLTINSACISASDPLCSTKAQYSGPVCTDYYQISTDTSKTAITDFVKCVCGLT